MDREISLPSEKISIPDGSPWSKLPLVGGVVGVLALVLSFALGLGAEHRSAFLFSYLTAYIFGLTFALGGLFFVLLQFLTRAGWSVVVRRLAEHVMATMPLFAVLFLPIAVFHTEIYAWAVPGVSDPSAANYDALIAHKAPYLNAPFFFVRSGVYLAVWTILAWYFARKSLAQDASGDVSITRRLQSRSALGMVLFAVTVNFAAFDWVMSLDPHWFSTIFGVYLFAGTVVTILATLILLVLRLQASGLLEGIVTWEHFHDLGKLLFGFVVFWAYIAFSQFMLIWYGNLPEETVWFAHRWEHGWKTLSIFLAAGHFGLPFFVLISQPAKRSRAVLTFATLWLFALHYVDIYWLVMPSLAFVDGAGSPAGNPGLHPTLFDLGCLVGVVGLFLAVLGTRLRGRPLVPIKDPRLGESLAFENA